MKTTRRIQLPDNSILKAVAQTSGLAEDVTISQKGITELIDSVIVGVQSVSGDMVDNTDPANPIVGSDDTKTDLTAFNAFKDDAQPTIIAHTEEITAIQSALLTKVDKVAGKGLSTNDLTDGLLTLITSAMQSSDLDGFVSYPSWDSGSYTLTLPIIGGTALSITLPFAETIVGLTYDDTLKSLVVTAQDGTITNVLLEDLIGGLVTNVSLTAAISLHDTSSAAHSDIRADVAEAQSTANLATSDLDSHKDDISNPHSVSATQVGLGDVDNTADIDKPVSTAQQIALDGKVNLTSATTQVLNSDIAIAKGKHVLGVKANSTHANLISIGDYGTYEQIEVGTETDPLCLNHSELAPDGTNVGKNIIVNYKDEDGTTQIDAIAYISDIADTVTTINDAIVTHDEDASAHDGASSKINNHLVNTSNPHNVTASQVGAAVISDITSAVSAHNTSGTSHTDIRTSISTHTDNTVVHISQSPTGGFSTERAYWNQKVNWNNLFTLIVNNTDEVIIAGTPMYLTSSGVAGDPQIPTISSDEVEPYVDGFAYQDIPVGGTGYLVYFGFFSYDTTGWDQADPVYLKSDGGITNVQPAGEGLKFGYVSIENSTNGQVWLSAVEARDSYTDTRIDDTTGFRNFYRITDHKGNKIVGVGNGALTYDAVNYGQLQAVKDMFTGTGELIGTVEETTTNVTQQILTDFAEGKGLGPAPAFPPSLSINDSDGEEGFHQWRWSQLLELWVDVGVQLTPAETPESILSKLIENTLGAGSGIDADTLRGYLPTAFATAAQGANGQAAYTALPGLATKLELSTGIAALIDDTTPSTSTVYSSSKIEDIVGDVASLLAAIFGEG